jgi:hypothetical protein
VLLKERGQLADGWRRRQRGAQEIAITRYGARCRRVKVRGGLVYGYYLVEMSWAGGGGEWRGWPLVRLAGLG